MLTLAVAAVCLLSLVQSEEAAVYLGPGVNGTSIENSGGKDVLLLGGLFPIHADENNGCGSILDFGFQRLEAMVLATKKINSDPSLLPGVTLGFEIRDTCTRTNKALEQGLKYVSARDLRSAGAENGTILGISGVVGAAYSRVSTSIARLLRLFRVPQISYASTANVLSDKAIFNYFLRTIPPDSLQARAMADIIEYFNWTYVIAMHTGDIYGKEGIKAFIDELGKRNSSQRCIATASIELRQGAEREDFESAVEKIDQAWIRNATVIVLFGQRDTATGILRAVGRKQESDPEFRSKNFTWIGSDGWGDMIPPEVYDIAQGSLSVIPRSSLSEDFDDYFQSLHPHNYSANPWFAEYWESVFNCNLGDRPGYEDCNQANQNLSPQSGYKQNSKVAFTMDAVYAFAHAAHKLQRDYCPDYAGLCSEILDKQVGHVSIRGDLLLKYLYNVSFGGVSTDVVSFDDRGDVQGGYVVKNLQRNSDGGFVFKIIGHWDEVPLDRSVSLDIYEEVKWSHNQGDEVPSSLCSYPCNGGEYPEPIADQAECCWICKVCPGTHDVSNGLECIKCKLGYIPNESRTVCIEIPPSYLRWSHGWSITILMLTLLGIISTTAVAVVFIVYHKHRLVKASSRELSAVLLTGIMLCYLLPFFFIAKPAPWICAVRRFGIGVCFSLCYSALLVKTNRIHRIFNRPSSSSQVPPLISPQSQLFFTALLVAVQVVVVTVWLVVEKPSIEYFYGEYVTELKCGESPHIGLSVSLIYNFLLLMATLYFAFRTRKVPQNFNEAKFINLTMYTLCVLWLAFIPTYYATANLGAIYQTASLVLAIVLNATVTLCLLFVPKIYFIFTKSEEDHFTQSSNYTTTRNINSIDQKSSRFSSLRFPTSGSDTGKAVHTSVPMSQHNTLELAKGNVCHGTITGSMDVEKAHVLQQLVDAATQTDM